MPSGTRWFFLITFLATRGIIADIHSSPVKEPYIVVCCLARNTDSSTLPHPQPHSHYACTHTHPCTRLPYVDSSGMHKVATAAGHLNHGRPCEWVTKERAVNGILFLKARIFRLVSVDFKTKVWRPLDGATYIQLWDLKAMRKAIILLLFF